jgi:hypothetical protein
MDDHIRDLFISYGKSAFKRSFLHIDLN